PELAVVEDGEDLHLALGPRDGGRAGRELAAERLGLGPGAGDPGRMPEGPVIVDPEQVETAGTPGGRRELAWGSKRLDVLLGRHRRRRYGIVDRDGVAVRGSAGEGAANGSLGRPDLRPLGLDARIERVGRAGKDAAEAPSA